MENSYYEELVEQINVDSIHIFEILEAHAVDYHVIMVALSTNTYPYLSVGFGANREIRLAINHAILESVHTYRGENWYALTQWRFDSTTFIKDFWNKVDNSIIKKKLISPKKKLIYFSG